MRIAIIGAGTLGRPLGRAFTAAGHAITFASRSIAGAQAAADTIPTSRASDIGTAVKQSDLAVLAVPYGAINEALDAAESFGGKILWSCVNALKADASGLATGYTTSAAEEVAARAVDARVVAALPPFAETIGRLGKLIPADTPDIFCCSDHPDAAATVRDLVSDIGARPVDAGPLRNSRYVEPAMMLVITLSFASRPPRSLALRLLDPPAA